MFEVKVEGVNLLNKPGKTRRFKNVAGKRNGYKKAYVRLQTGQSIDFTGGSVR
jgi:large subunit ribosomal protein L23